MIRYTSLLTQSISHIKLFICTYWYHINLRTKRGQFVNDWFWSYKTLYLVTPCTELIHSINKTEKLSTVLWKDCISNVWIAGLKNVLADRANSNEMIPFTAKVEGCSVPRTLFPFCMCVSSFEYSGLLDAWLL